VLPDVAVTRLDGTIDAHRFRGKWTLLVVDSGACAQACAQKLYATRQARTMQGKERDRVDRVWLYTGDARPPPELVAAHPDLAVLTDEIYGRIVHDGEAVSLGSYPGMAERTITLDGFSKTYAMTGWRLGYAIVPPFLLEAYKQLIINSVSCTSMFSQVAAVEALTGPQDEVEAMVAEFRARRELIVDGLNAIDGIECRTPAGAFYVFPDISGTGLTGAEFADRLLVEEGVCTLAGTAFGKVGRDHVRVSYANSRENLREALDRIARFAADARAGRIAIPAG
jgi:aspartate/methionine/tyrosine aminotransferase